MKDNDYTPARRKRDESGHGGSSFLTMFGGSMGCLVAAGLLLVALFVGFAIVCGGCFVAVSNVPMPPTKQR